MENVPLYIQFIFVLTTLSTVFFLYKATNNAKAPLLLSLAWLALTTIISLNGFFTVTNTLPPRFLVLVAPPLLLIATLFVTRVGRQFLNKLDIKTLTLLHVVRVPVELVLYFLFLYKAVPQLMTFEGNNYDILSGLSAPLIYYVGFVRRQISNKAMMLWHLVCLALLFNIVLHAVLSAPSPFQQFAFDQPNRAVLYFPFVWLPACVVPLVLFAHLVALRNLWMAAATPYTAMKSMQA